MSIRALDSSGQGSEPSRSPESGDSEPSRSPEIGDADKTKTESVYQGRMRYLSFPSMRKENLPNRDKQVQYAQGSLDVIREDWVQIAKMAQSVHAIATAQAEESSEEEGSPIQWLNQQKRRFESKIKPLEELGRRVILLSEQVEAVTEKTEKLKNAVNAGSQDDLAGSFLWHFMQ